MNFHCVVFGYGLTLEIWTHSFDMDARTIFSWSIVRRYIVWRGERHLLMDGRYGYRCIKNGEDVESFSLRSPIENHKVNV